MNNIPHDHILRSADEDRARLLDEIVRMGEMAAAQLEAALDLWSRRDGNAPIEVSWHAFQLNPGIPKEGIARDAEFVDSRWITHVVYSRLSTDDPSSL